MRSTLLSRFTAVVQSQIDALPIDPSRLKVPLPRGERRRIPGSPFHIYPELFLQVTGTTVFTLPEQRITLGPGEMCIMPRLLPHAERVSAAPDRSFSNVVMMIGPDAFSFHFAAESERRRGDPVAGESARFLDADAPRMADALDAVAALSWKTGAEDHVSRSALVHTMLGVLYRILVLFRDGSTVALAGHPKVVAARNQIALNISDPTLSVRSIADWIHCSPDYLSSIFHQETGETVIAHITRRRMRMAESLLCSTTLAVGEVAWTCGYHDPAYFCRVFKSRYGVSPGSYRVSSTHSDQPDDRPLIV